MSEFSTELLDPKGIAEALYEAIQYESNYSERSLQSREFRAGVSDLGFCSERTRRMIDQQVPEDKDSLAAWIGTWLGTGMETAATRVWPNADIQAQVSVTLHGERRTYTLTGHPDLVDGESGLVVDFKTDFGLADVERAGPSLQQQFQRHSYAKGAWEQGYFGDRPLSEVRVANVWMDRGAVDKYLHVDIEPYNEDYVTQAGIWLDDVVYAYLNGEEAQKEPPREMCEKVCGFFKVCRAYDTDVEGLLTAPEVIRAAAQYDEGREMAKEGKRLVDQAKVHLEDISGSTGEFLVRWTHINASTERRGYDKLEVKRIPRRQP